MSCPDWTSLTAHRAGRRAQEPAGWDSALAHFDGGCRLCRKAALKSDPTLVFRRLAQVPAAAMTAAEERAEVDSVRRAVAAMRAASRLEKRRRRTAGGWMRWSAAAALALLALTLPADHARRAARLDGGLETAGAVEQRQELPARAARQDRNAPVLEGGVDLPGARVYHLGDQELTVVMVIDESFDESFGS